MANEEQDTQADQVEPPSPAQEWRPIESVPRDGTIVDLWMPSFVGGDRVIHVWWETVEWVRRGFERLEIQDGYTYWMPPPPSPPKENQ